MLPVPPRHQEVETPREKRQVHLQGVRPGGGRQEASLRSGVSRLMRLPGDPRLAVKQAGKPLLQGYCAARRNDYIRMVDAVTLCRRRR